MKVSSSKLEKHQKCMRCDEIPCINFYRWTKGKPAGEITTYKRMIKALDWRPCEAGSLIYYFCQVFQPFQDDFLSGSLLYQCIRDLKSCVFLLWFGHYRSSLQILRPIVENFLAALYLLNFNPKPKHTLFRGRPYNYYSDAGMENLWLLILQMGTIPESCSNLTKRCVVTE